MTIRKTHAPVPRDLMRLIVTLAVLAMLAVRLSASGPQLSTNVMAIAAAKTGLDERWAVQWTWRTDGQLVLDDRLQSSSAPDARPPIPDPFDRAISGSRGSTTTRGAAYADLAGRDYAAFRTRLASLIVEGRQRPWELLAAAKYDESNGRREAALEGLRRGSATRDLLDLADRALTDGAISRARGLAELAYAAFPHSARAAALFGHILVVHGTTTESIQRAIEVLRAGLDANADFGAIRLDYAHALMNVRRYDEAAVELTTAGAARPRDPVLHLLNGELLLVRGNLREAEREYATSFDLDNGQLWALFGLGRVYAAEGQTERAAATWRRVLAIDPAFQAARDALQGAK